MTGLDLWKHIQTLFLAKLFWKTQWWFLVTATVIVLLYSESFTSTQTICLTYLYVIDQSKSSHIHCSALSLSIVFSSPVLLCSCFLTLYPALWECNQSLLMNWSSIGKQYTSKHILTHDIIIQYLKNTAAPVCGKVIILSVIYGFVGWQRWNDKLHLISIDCVALCWPVLSELFFVSLGVYLKFN